MGIENFMDLIDLIGDSRTESLPPGFLRSIKIKYKQESSRVFPPGTPYKTDDVKGPNKTKVKEGEFRRSMSVDSDVSVPVSLLLQQKTILCEDYKEVYMPFTFFFTQIYRVFYNLFTNSIDVSLGTPPPSYDVLIFVWYKLLQF